MLSSSSAELILTTSQRCGWLRSTISAEFPLTSFIFSPHRVRAAKKVQTGTLSSLVEGELQRGIVPTTATSWCWKACGCWLHWERRKKNQRHGSVLHLYMCCFQLSMVPSESESSFLMQEFLCSSVRLEQAWISMSVATAARMTFCRNQKNKDEVQIVTELWHTATFGRMIPRVLPGLEEGLSLFPFVYPWPAVQNMQPRKTAWLPKEIAGKLGDNSKLIDE